jgi:predicted Zn finger-like uncharacterized protein
MALATQCPHCHTTFRVAHDQLKLRAGLVRCGSCKQIFNGIENLLRPDDVAPASGSASAPPSPPSQADSVPTPVATAQPASFIAPDESADVSEEPPQTTPSDKVTGAGSAAEATTAPTAAEETDNPLLRMTLMDFTHASQKPTTENTEQATRKSAEQSDSLEQTIDDLQRKPWRRVEDDADVEADELDLADHLDYEEPSFVRQGRRRQRISHALRIAMWTTLPFLLAGLLAQGSYVFRDQLAASLPQAKPLLARACAYIGCQIGLPMKIESVSIESSELQALSASQNTFSLVALLRNRGETVLAWPSIELTLNDASEKPLGRRVFMPRDYLPSQQEINRGFAPKSEQSIKLFFELSQLKASGYRVYLFYP